MKSKIFILPFVILMFCTALNAQRLKIAVMDFSNEKRVSHKISLRVSEWLRSELITKNFDCIDQSTMNSFFIKHSFKQKVCKDNTCAVKAGKILNVDKILIGTVKKFDRKIIIYGKLIDVRNGIVDTDNTISVKSVSDLDTGVKLFAAGIDKDAAKFVKEQKVQSISKDDNHYQGMSPDSGGKGFQGTWQTTYGELKMINTQGGINGLYYNGKASLSGRVSGNRLDFTWKESTGSGSGYFILSSDKMTFSGYWFINDDTKFQWEGKRIK